MVQSPTDLLVLQGLRLKGFVEASILADFLGMSPSVVEASLQQASESGLALFRDGARTGWSLTAEGRKESERLLAAELDSSNRRSDVESVYRDFLGLNQTMLEVCTKWQVTDLDTQTLNDHGDDAYDASVVAELAEIDSQVQPMCAELGGWFNRLDNYGPRFINALSKIQSGDKNWFTKPTIESYHTVWFELHEDLLTTLGIDRASERA